MAALSKRARELAERVLAPLPLRLAHTAGVARRAALLGVRLADPGGTADPDALDPDLLLAAAWLHDLGYAPSLQVTGFHPLDGARYLDGLGWATPLSPLVAHHSGARFVAAARGLAGAMREYPFEESPLTDALTFADQTVGQAGQPMTVQERIDDALRRHAGDPVRLRAHALRGPYLLAVASRVTARLRGPVGSGRAHSTRP